MKKTFLLTCLLWGISLATLCAQQPGVVGSYPPNDAKDIIRNVYISVAIRLPNGDLDGATVNNQSVILYPTANSSVEVPAFITFKNDLKNITLEPYSLLEMYTFYTFEITSRVTDVTGQAFEPYSITFFTGETAFQKMISLNRNKKFGESLSGEEPDPEPVTPVDLTLTPEEERALLEIELLELKHGADDFDRIQASGLYKAPPKTTQVNAPGEIALLASESDLDELASMSKKISSGDLQVLASSTTNISESGTEPLATIDPGLPETLDTLAITPIPVEKPPVEEPPAMEPPVTEAPAVVSTPYLKPIPLTANLDEDAYKLSLSYPPVPYNISLIDQPIPYDLLDQMAQAVAPEEEDIDAGFEEGKTEKTEVKPGKTVKGVIRFPKSSLPRGSSLPIEFTFNEREEIRFVLRTYGGDILVKESGYLNRGLHKRAVELAGIEPGTYYAVVETTAQKVTKKIVILR